MDDCLQVNTQRAVLWDLEEMRKVEKDAHVKITTTKQCMYGVKTCGNDRIRKDTPAWKRTKCMATRPSIAGTPSRIYEGGRVRQHLMNGRANEAAQYPDELCSAICARFIGEMNNKRATIQMFERR